jgi:Tol biopolymer transport system component
MPVRLLATILAAALTFGSTAATQKPGQAEALLQKAAQKETVDGDLKAAIDLYKQALAAAGNNRAVAAKALVQMGECYEKQGNVEAQKAYQHVITSYADQAEAVARASARLVALGQGKALEGRAAGEKAGVILSELRLQSGQIKHVLSPDGNKIAYTYAKPGNNLFVRDIASGADKQITNLEKSGTALNPVWSPDGKRILYVDFQNPSKYEMRIVSLETGEDRHTEINGWPYDWSRDGRFILYGEGGVDKPRATLNLLPVDGGPIREIMSGDGSTYFNADRKGLRLSPDGKYIAYSSGEDRAYSLFLIPVEGGEPIRITQGPFYDADPIWAPDGKTLLFVSTRSLGRIDLWGVRVLNGKASGEPFVVKPDVGQVRLFSLTENGRLLFARQEIPTHVYLTEIDPKTGQAAGEAIQMTKNSAINDNWRPTWAPDGKRIAYTGLDGLRVMSADGSNDRVLAKVAIMVGSFAWAPDNDHIYFAERRAGTGTGIYSISVSTGEIKPVLLDLEIRGHVACSPDGKRLAFLKGLQNLQIYLADIDGKNLRQVTFDDRSKVAYPAWSPDGKQLAFYKWGAGDSRTSLWLLSVDDGRLTEVLEGPNTEHTFWDISWSPDGNRIAWHSVDGTKESYTPPMESSRTEIRVLRLAPGEKPQALRPNLGPAANVRMQTPAWSPDGKKMAFVAGTSIYQLLVMDNFLPKPEEPESGNVNRMSP